MIALTHVCRDWREVFTSRSSLWTGFCCEDADKTRVYLQRSKSSPIDLWIYREDNLLPHDPIHQVIPLATSRLKSLRVEGSLESLPDITARLTHPAPLLEDLLIDGTHGDNPEYNPVLPTSLFNGDLSSLHKLCLEGVQTELPWRNMVNLTSFDLWCAPPGEVSVRHLLNFFENAPRLRKINFDTPTTSGVRNGRLVSLKHLKKVVMVGDALPSILLDHLLVPVGAKLTTRIDIYGPMFENHLPRSLDNIRNLSGFTRVRLCLDSLYSNVQFSGPNGQVHMFSLTSHGNPTHLAFGSLGRFNTLKTERLRIDYGDPLSSDSVYQVLLPMKDLRTLTLNQCRNPHFIRALCPGISPSGVVVCPNLEELILIYGVRGETPDIEGFRGMAAARASRGTKLNSIRILTHLGVEQFDTSELEEHVSHVECGPEVTVSDDNGYSSDEEY